MACFDQGPFDGGVYTHISVSDSQITNTAGTSLTLKDSTFTGNVTLDQTAANAALSALQDATPQVSVHAPTETTGTDLPTTMTGAGRRTVLGEPDQWIRLGDYVIPAYKVK